jgi:hypothetical protein
MGPKQQKQTTTVAELTVEGLQSLITQSVASALKPVQDSMGKLQKEVTGLRKQVESLKEELAKKDVVINKLETEVMAALDEREQYSRRNNVRIFGVAEKDNEDTNQLVVDIAAKLNVQLEDCHIDRSHRIGKVGDMPRPIIVKFVSYAERSAVFRSKKLLRGTKITIREDLTKMRLSLLKEAVSLYSTKAVWSSDGVILVNVGKDRPFRVKTAGDLENLVEKHPPGDN